MDECAEMSPLSRPAHWLMLLLPAAIPVAGARCDIGQVEVRVGGF